MELPGAISNLKQKIKKQTKFKECRILHFCLSFEFDSGSAHYSKPYKVISYKLEYFLNFVLEILKIYSFYVKIFFEFGFRNSRKLIFQFYFMNLKKFFLFIKTFLY